MNYIKNRFHIKRLYALLIAVTISFAVISSIKPAYSSEGSVIDPILDAIFDYSHSAIDKIATAMVDGISGSFQPSFDLYDKMTDNINYEIEKAKENSGVKITKKASYYRTNLIINNVVTFCERFGVVLSTILALFSLLMCILGRSEYIRDTPIGIIVKYIIAMSLIFLSWETMYYIMTVINDLWTNFVMTSSAQKVTYSDFAQNLSVDTSSSNVALLSISISNAFVLTKIDKMIFSFVGIFLIWKLFKQFLRLYVEIAERYFVLTMMSFFAPAVMSTITTNSTINIFSSYMRMYVSQSFILLCNGIFMKIFIAVLILGGWTCSIFNYICALAYMKFCMKLDSYMMSMGLNIAQTGSGFLDSFGGGARTLMNAARSLGMADRAVSNHGKALMAQGTSTNNKAVYDKGAQLASGLKGFMGSKPVSSNNQFSTAMAKASTPANTRTGNVFKTNGTLEGINEVANKINIPSSSVQSALSNANISPSQVSLIKQLNGSKQFSNNAGTRFAMRDNKGNNLAVIDGSNIYTNSNLQNDIEKWNANEQVADFFSADDFKANDMNVASAIRQASSEKTFGVQHYVVSTPDQDNGEMWEATMVAQHPSCLDDRNAILTYNNRGDAISLKKVSSQAHNKKG